MFEFPTKKPGDPVTAKDFNTLSAAIQQCLAGIGSGGSKQAVGSTTVFAGGKMWERESGFTIRLVTRQGEGWVAYFNPGAVVEIKLGSETKEHTPELNGQPMTDVPFPALTADDGDVYLIVSINDEGDVDKAVVQVGKNEDKTPWGNRIVDLWDGPPAEAGNIHIKLGKFETVGETVRYTCYHAGDVTVMRPGLRQKLVHVPDAIFAAMDGSEVTTGSGVYKPINNVENWELWHSPLCVGPGLKIERHESEASALPYYKIKGDGFGLNGTITFKGYNGQYGADIEYNDLTLRIRDGFIKNFTGGDWLINCTDLIVKRTDDNAIQGVSL